MADVAHLVRASGCGSEGRGFDPLHSPHRKTSIQYRIDVFLLPYCLCYTTDMQLSSLLKRIVSLEYLFAAVLVALFFVNVGHFDWWWLIILFPLFDASMIGYLISSHVGAITYNIVHSLIGPAMLTVLYIFTAGHTAADSIRQYSADSFLLFIILIWLFHIFVDRALGFGLKHSEGFHHTHLGKIGKAAKK